MMNIVNFETEEDVKAWVKLAEEKAYKAWHAQQDFKNTKKVLSELIHEKLEKVFPSYLVSLSFRPFHDSIEDEQTFFNVEIRISTYEIISEDEDGIDYDVIDTYETYMPCGKHLMTDTQALDRFIESATNRLNKQIPQACTV